MNLESTSNNNKIIYIILTFEEKIKSKKSHTNVKDGYYCSFFFLYNS